MKFLIAWILGLFQKPKEEMKEWPFPMVSPDFNPRPRKKPAVKKATTRKPAAKKVVAKKTVKKKVK